MKTRRRTYTAETPASTLFPEALPAPINARGDRRSKKKKCITGLWDQNIPTDLLQEILSRLRLKDNIHASSVCKTWCEAAVSVRKLQPRPWLFYPKQGSEDGGDYILSGPSHSQTYNLNFPELKYHGISYSMDGWLLVLTDYPSDSLLLNPFTQERIYLPNVPCYSSYLAFSAAPTSSSCLVISLNTNMHSFIEINTWRPGETVLTTHLFENQPVRTWNSGVFFNGMFYCLSTCGYLGVFDPARATWNNLPVKPCPTFRLVDFGMRTLMMEHEGDIFVLFTSCNKNPSMFKLNLKRKVWEEKRELGGLTVFASCFTSLIRAASSAEERNRIYPSYEGWLGVYCFLGHDKISSCPPPCNYFSNRIAWVDPPHHTR